MILDTDMGRVRTVQRHYVAEYDSHVSLLFECPGCAAWLPLSEAMFYGKVSMDHATDGCPGGYHETVDLSAAQLKLTMREVEVLRGY